MRWVTLLKKHGVLNINYTNVMFVGEVGDSSKKYGVLNRNYTNIMFVGKVGDSKNMV